VKALAVSGSPMLITFSNDYGYKDVFKKFIELFANKGKACIAIVEVVQRSNAQTLP